MLTAAVQADDKEGPIFTDPNNAGPDYAAQGEFKGTLAVDDNRPWGAQVIALGDGKYRLVGYPDGLPGDGYVVGNEVRTSEGQREGDKVVFKDNEFTITQQGDTLTVSVDGKDVGQIKRVQRTSPTLGKQPPAGAIVLFDGSGAEKFAGGKMTADKLLQSETASLEKFGNHQLHIEFRTPFKPLARGQARGNSGVYVQSRYEVQVLDSFGLSGEDNECGGIYKIAKPRVNMCFPPLTWQTYDIDFTAAKYDDAGKKTSNARITVKHNGVTIHDKLELKSGTPGRLPEGPTPEPLYLQGHGNPVVYRNVWVVK
jgi:hypothetical protein